MPAAANLFSAVPRGARRCPIDEPGWRGDELAAALGPDAGDVRLLRLLAVSELAEPGAATDPRFAPLVRRVACAEPVWLDAFVRALAGTPGLSEPAVVAAVEAAAAWSRAGRPGGRQLVAAALRTPADASRALRHWRSRHGGTLPKPVKRGLADAVTRLFTVDGVARYGRAHVADLLRAVHPVPATPAQSEAFRAVLEGSARGDPVRPPATAWAAAIPAMSVPELLRHLPHFDRAGLDDETAAAVMARLAAPPPGLSPLLVYRRYRQARTRRWDGALAAALGVSIAGLPRWPGRTLLMVGLHGGGDTWGRRPRRRPAGDLPHQARFGATPGMLAVALGGALRLAGNDVDVVGSDGRTLHAADPAQLLAAVDTFADFRPGRPEPLWAGLRYSTYDRVVLVSVHDGWHGDRHEPRVPVEVPLFRFGYRHERGGPRFHVTGRHVEFWGLTEHAAWLGPLWEDALSARSTP